MFSEHSTPTQSHTHTNTHTQGHSTLTHSTRTRTHTHTHTHTHIHTEVEAQELNAPGRELLLLCLRVTVMSKGKNERKTVRKRAGERKYVRCMTMTGLKDT